MTLRVRDLIEEVLTREIETAVQISSFRGPQNPKLLGNYIFTCVAPGRRKSSVDVLREVCSAFRPGAVENRFCVLANYGHGKSHFGLAMANYFGHSHNSAEGQLVLDRLRSAIGDSGPYGELEDFRQRRKPMLVLLLSGDDPYDLKTKFYRAVREALGATQGDSSLPFWLKDAERFLTGLSGDYLKCAQQYLEPQELDVAALLVRVREGRSDTYAIVRALSEQLFGMPLDLGGGLSLKEAVHTLVAEKCGLDGEYGGVLLLFDEFSAFVDKYSATPVHDTPLQDLLNGISDAHENAAFVAFSQHDPNTVAEFATQGNALQAQSIARELDRLPKPYRYQLHSSLEHVLESYLRKRAEPWLAALGETDFRQALDDATTKALTVFRKRYIDDLNWGTEHFHEVVTAGAFPLHPLTTSLLCSVELNKSQNPRSVLGFVGDAVARLLARDVTLVDTSGVSWIRPIELVDYFGEALGTEEWSQYTRASRKINAADEPVSDRVIKAVLLATLGKAQTKAIGYAQMVAEFVGMPRAEAERVLDELYNRGVIDRDPVTLEYRFDEGPGGEFQDLLKRRKSEARLDPLFLHSAGTYLRQAGLLPKLNVDVDWGHREDWYAEQVITTRAQLSTEYLAGIRRTFLRWNTEPSNNPELARGLVVWVLAESDDDVSACRSFIPDVLGKVVGMDVAPIVVMRPESPSSLVIDRLKTFLALSQFSTPERSKYAERFGVALKSAREALGAALASNQTLCSPEVPSAFRAQLTANPPSGLPQVVAELFRMSYPHVLSPWYNEFRLTSGRLPTAVASLCTWLVDGKTIAKEVLTNRPLETGIAQKYLQQRWKLLADDGRLVPPPPDSAARNAWDELDTSFPQGGNIASTKSLLDKLLNPPYGYDWNTLALLMSVWLGANRGLISSDGKTPGFDAPSGAKPRDLVLSAARLRICRLDEGPILEEVRSLVAGVSGQASRSQAQARKDVAKLQAFVDGKIGGDDLKAQARAATDRLQEALARSSDYDNKVREILASSDRENSLQVLKTHLDKVERLGYPALVTPSGCGSAELRAHVCARMNQVADGVRTRYGHLTGLESYEHNKRQLELNRGFAKEAGVADAVSTLDTALGELEDARRILIEKISTTGQLRVIQALPDRGPTTDLRLALQRLNDIVPSETVRSVWSDKKAAITRELERLQHFATGIGVRLDEATTSSVLRRLRDDIVREQNLLDEDEQKQQAASVITRCDALLVYLADLERIASEVRQSVGDFERGERDVESAVNARQGVLGEKHAELADVVRQSLAAKLESRRREAGEQLAKARKENEAGTPAASLFEVLGQKNGLWQFLTEDGRRGLDDLRGELRERMGKQKIGTIEHSFRSLDARLRGECIERLQIVERELSAR